MPLKDRDFLNAQPSKNKNWFKNNDWYIYIVSSKLEARHSLWPVLALRALFLVLSQASFAVCHVTTIWANMRNNVCPFKMACCLALVHVSGSASISTISVVDLVHLNTFWILFLQYHKFWQDKNDLSKLTLRCNM